MSTMAQTFLKEIETFLARSGMKASAFGWEAVKDPNFVGDLRAGRSPSLALVDRVHSFIKEKSASASKVSAA